MELTARTGFRLLHYHLTVNLVSAVFERDSDVWGRMLGKLRREMLTAAAEHNVNLILTGVFRGTPDNVEAWCVMLVPVEAHGGLVLFVQLTCERQELLRRVQQEDRRVLDKLVDTVRMSELLERFDLFSPAPFGPHYAISGA